MKKIITALLILATGLIFCSCNMLNYTYANGNKYSAGAAVITGDVKNLDINWVSGKVDIVYSDIASVKISETSNKDLTDDLSVHYWFDDDTLRIKFTASGHWKINLSKMLKVELPSSLLFDNFKVSVASAEVSIPETKAKNVRVATASGDVTASFCDFSSAEFDSASGNINLTTKGKVGDIEVDTASGDITLTLEEANKVNVDSASGKVKILSPKIENVIIDTASGDITMNLDETDKVSVDTASGNITLDFAASPDNCSIETASGDVMVFLPKDASFKLNFDTASGDFDCDFPTVRKNKTYTCGNGDAIFEIDTASGDVTFKMK